MKISKEQFMDYMNRLIEYKHREENLSKSMNDYSEGLYFFSPKDVLELIVDMLKDLTNDDKDNSIIDYWIYELDYGSKWVPYTIIDDGCNDVKLQTVEDLYNYLKGRG